ncbi:adhesion G-protein coupled receptor F1-like [Xyrauchen texanus]|uniref:adhesion G-protein coupled receptor F1-like n=1 Tax=Xyrauchen texanus TaxID=154827 RepID=UPI0022426853|nr:adhesion G-protein coupled receptor F1-like [Xyrauchen texanus]
MFELEIEASIYNKITSHLLNFITNVGNATVSNFNFTTECTLKANEKNCSCNPGYTWTSDICQKYKCCSNDNCTLNINEPAVCLSDKRVSISGTTTMNEYKYNDLFDVNKTPKDQFFNKTTEIMNKLKSSFSTLPWFDSLVITNIRSGSVIVDYTVKLLGPVTNLTQLENIANSLSGSNIVTKGLVTINVPQNQPIDIESSVSVNCTPQEDLGPVTWLLVDTQNKTTKITNGVEATLQTNAQLTDTVYLTSISGSWKGTFTCQYTRNSIQHIASDQLDIALLPDIHGKSEPQFPDCRSSNKISKVTIFCSITESAENYIVTWKSPDLTDLTSQQPQVRGGFISYKVDATIDCTKPVEEVNVTCIFTNNRAKINRDRQNTVIIPIINDKSLFCEAEKSWPITKNTYQAIIACDYSSTGEKQRLCDGTWQKEISFCVNLNLYDIQKNVQELIKGLGMIKEEASKIFNQLHQTTINENIISYANINASVNILDGMNIVTQKQSNQWNDTVIPDFIKSASNLLNVTEPWLEYEKDNYNLSIKYLQTVESTIRNANISKSFNLTENVNLALCYISNNCNISTASVTSNDNIVAVEFRNLAKILPRPLEDKSNLSDAPILSVISANQINGTGVFNVMLSFSYADRRLRNHKMFCVFWDENLMDWSEKGCSWGGMQNPNTCTCDHNTSFTMLMSKSPESLPYMDELTYVGLGISIVSLVLCLLIEFLVWDMVVKSNVSNFRHIALVNISICLLLAYIAFLASANPKNTPANWCVVLTVFKHFSFLSVFFWMLCLSFVLLHQIIFVFSQLRKKVYVGLSITLGYVCPFLSVAITVISFDNGKDGEYYSNETCWLTYKGALKGSIFAFVIPVGTIVFINMFTLFVVITKIVTPTVSEAKARDEKDVAKSILKTLVFLCPVLGITWIFGLFVLIIDLTAYPLSYIVNYAFTLLNTLQGFFILLTNCFGEKKVRDALLKRFKGKQSVQSKNESSTKAVSSVMKK